VTRIVDWQVPEPDFDVPAECLRAGGVVVVPTDSFYGVACDAFSAVGLERLKSIRGMDPSTLPTVLVADVRMAHALTTDVPPFASALMERYWPGALTLVLNAAPSLSWDLGAAVQKVPLRVPSHEGLRNLVTMVGPIVVSGAHQVGDSPSYSLSQALRSLGVGVDLAVDGGVLPVASPSTFVDCTSETVDLVRLGPVDLEDVMEVVRACAGVGLASPKELDDGPSTGPEADREAR